LVAEVHIISVMTDDSRQCIFLPAVDKVTTLADIDNTSVCPHLIFMYSLVDCTRVIFMCILVGIVFGAFDWARGYKYSKNSGQLKEIFSL